MKITAPNVESIPSIMPSGRGKERTIVIGTSAGNLSINNDSPLPCESLTTNSVAPASRAP
jgi:hypothetical protein